MKVILMQGLPGSGKSYRAKRIQKREPNIVRINADLMREMLHFGVWNTENERLVKRLEYALAISCLSHGVSIIVDNCNLSDAHLKGWTSVADRFDAEVVVEKMYTHWTTCVKRDQEREKKVGAKVIKDMAKKYGMYKKESNEEGI